MILMKDLRVIFMGTPDFSVPVLKKLISNCNVVLVVTQPDKKVGRKQEIKFSPVKEVAIENNIEVYQPERIKEEYQKVINTPCDIIITCAYGQIIPKEILDFPRLGCVNVHASLLPKNRGGAPIHWAIIRGERRTGITIMYMAPGMDDGGIINGTNERISQDESEVTFSYAIKREQERLDFNLNGKDIVNRIRGLNPWPLANILINGEEMKVYEASFESKDIKEIGKVIDVKKDSIGITCADGVIYLKKIKPFGKRTMEVKDYLNGVKLEDIFNWNIN